MNEEQIKQTVLKILGRIAPESDPSQLGPDENIRRALDIDSYDALNFFIHLNEELGVSIPESDYGRLNTMADMIKYLSRRTK